MESRTFQADRQAKTNESLHSLPPNLPLPPPPATPQPAPACTHSAVGWGRPQGGSLKKLRLDWRSFTQEFWIPAASEVLAVSRQWHPPILGAYSPRHHLSELLRWSGRLFLFPSLFVRQATFGEAVGQRVKVLSFSSVQFSLSVVSDSLRPHELQQARPPCPSPTPGAYLNSCPFSQWCHPTISSCVLHFSSCSQSFPASGSFQMSQLQAAKVLEFQLQHQSFQWTLRTDLL